MNDSHLSLQQDYEVTGIELDTIVEAALRQEGVIGARMTGAGFGGCGVSIVKEAAIENFIKNVGKEYKEKSAMMPPFMWLKPAMVRSASCGYGNLRLTLV